MRRDDNIGRAASSVAQRLQRGGSAMLGRFVTILLMLVAQAAIALASVPVAPLDGEIQRNDQRTELRLAQAQTQQVEAPVVKKRITIIYKELKCLSNMVRIDAKCKCPDGTEWNEGEQICLKIVSVINCPKGSTQVGDRCVRCPPEMYLNNGKCTCPEPLIKKGNRCEEIEIATPKCSPPTTMVNGVCMMPCPAGTALNNEGRCTCSQPGMTLINGQCSCSEGTIERENRCVTPPQIAISPSELPDGSFDMTYPDTQFVGNGGTGPYTFKVEGKLPPGLTISPSGLLSGVPVQDGAFAFTVGVIDKDDFKGTRNYSITIEANDAPTEQAPCPYGTVRFGADCVKDATVATPQPPVYPTTPTAQPPVYPTTTLYPREVQTELKRVGCLAGRVDGIWGNGSRSALRKFYGRAGLSAADTEPSQVVLSDVQSQRERICPAVYVAPIKPPTTTVKTGGYKPKCSKIKYAYTSGKTCKCSGGRNFNGKYCVKTQTASPPPPDGGSTFGTLLGVGLCIAAQSQCNKKGGNFNSNDCSCSYSSTPKCYKQCDDCETVCE